MIINGKKIPGVKSDAEYLVEKLDARKQFHLFCRVAPLMTSSQVAASLVTAEDPEEYKVKVLESVLQAITGSLSHTSAENIDYILTTCLSVCKRKDGVGWAHVQAPGTTTIMYPDIGIETTIPLVMAAIEENLGSFFSSSPLASPA